MIRGKKNGFVIITKDTQSMLSTIYRFLRSHTSIMNSIIRFKKIFNTPIRVHKHENTSF